MARIEGVTDPGVSLARLVFLLVRRRLGRVVRPLRIHALRPKILRGYSIMEASQEGSDALPKHLKKLAQIRASTRIGCPF